MFKKLNNQVFCFFFVGEIKYSSRLCQIKIYTKTKINKKIEFKLNLIKTYKKNINKIINNKSKFI